MSRVLIKIPALSFSLHEEGIVCVTDSGGPEPACRSLPWFTLETWLPCCVYFKTEYPRTKTPLTGCYRNKDPGSIVESRSRTNALSGIAITTRGVRNDAGCNRRITARAAEQRSAAYLSLRCSGALVSRHKP